MDFNDTNDAIKKQIDPYVKSIGLTILSGWKNAHDKYGDDTILSPRSMASIINDYIVFEGKKRLKEFDVRKVNQSVRFTLYPQGNDERTIVFRFKKLTKKLRAMNARTQAAFNFASQIGLDGDGFAPPLNMNAGYVENEAKTEISAYLTCPKDMDRNKLVFHLPLNNKDLPLVCEIIEPEPIIPHTLDNRPFSRQQPKLKTGTDEVEND